MLHIFLVNEVYKPTNIARGHHLVSIPASASTQNKDSTTLPPLGKHAEAEVSPRDGWQIAIELADCLTERSPRSQKWGGGVGLS